MKVVSFKTRDGVKAFGDEVAQRLAGLKAEFGVAVKQERGTYDPHANTFTMKFTFTAPSADGEVNPYAKEAAAWKVYCRMEDLPEDALGKVITVQGKPFTIVGFEPRRRKFPVVLLGVGKDRPQYWTADATRGALVKAGFVASAPKPSTARWGTALAGAEGLNPNGAGKCGDCLMERVAIVNLNADGTCPESDKHAEVAPPPRTNPEDIRRMVEQARARGWVVRLDRNRSGITLSYPANATDDPLARALNANMDAILFFLNDGEVK